MPMLASPFALITVLLSGGCGGGEVADQSVSIPDDQPESYTERSAHHPEPGETASESPVEDSEQPRLNTYGPSGPGVAPEIEPERARDCDLMDDGCAGCTTFDSCCACYGGDVAVCEAACSQFAAG
ncbi:MAG: hypothetical protein JW751_08050 [Polyangiaceae bacterium]|nr:hypothetical protein [Polyangiaceae bacterium]